MDDLYHLMDQKHLFIDYSQSEIKDITKAVRVLLTRVISCFNARNDKYFITGFVPGGSMVERARIWENQAYPMIEFDFLVLLQYRYETQHVGYGCPGHLKILNFQTNKGSDGRYQMREEDLTPGDVVKDHYRTLLKILADACKRCDGGHICCVKKEAYMPCTCLKVDTESGWLELVGLDNESKGYLKPIVMKWNSKVKTLIKPDISKQIDINETSPSEVTIMADFIPGFKFSRLKIPEVFGYNFPHFPKNIEKPDHFYLVPKHCSKNHSTCWRISYCATEVKSMVSTSQKHRDAYKMIKVFKNYALDNTILSTYCMKSVVLRHIDNCEHVDHLMEPCLIEMLEYTRTCFKQKALPHFVLGHNLLEGKVYFKNGKQEKIFLNKFKTLIRLLKTDKFASLLQDSAVKDNSAKIKSALLQIADLLTDHRKY
ncbi:uncharacterized protein LOC123560395 [Mercenaria mercenaria]|uniref:uncharacterized protein LOC123560395 n=1 Tax=Mercenaria mercenaria TaxID=6596 RepID=UPI00234E5592|nr:uncharacterized protein LOC123560395 [Mercenaria mercenaria]